LNYKAPIFIRATYISLVGANILQKKI